MECFPIFENSRWSNKIYLDLIINLFAIGQYWGEMGYMRLEMGKNLLGIEGEIAFAVPGEL